MSENAPEARPLEERVREVIESFRPYIQADGGDIEFVAVEDAVVKVRLQGACTSCPMSQVTLKMGVEKQLRERVPEVQSVEAVS